MRDDFAARPTVLVVDDDEFVREVVGEMFDSLGYACLNAASGPEALRVLSNFPEVDLLFADVRMPGGMSGVDLARAARRLRPDLPVILSSAWTAGSTVPDGIPFLQKPYRLQDLVALVGRAHSGASVD